MRLARGIVAVLLLTPSARTVAAQITTFVPPKPAPRPDTTQKTVAEKAAEKRDSVSRLTLTSMKAWVDSAVGLPAPSPVPPRDTIATSDVDRADSLFRDHVLPPAPTRFFSNGAIAPATASNLPAMVAAGVVSLLAGLLLLRSGRRPASRGSS